MSSPKSSARRPPKPSPDLRPKSSALQQSPPEVVDPIWLAQALALSLIAALACAWLTVCLLFYQGEWQLILHPTRSIDRTPASIGLAFNQIRFDATETGQPRLTAWWVPAGAGAKYEPYIVLYLHDGAGSLSTTVDSLARLHQAGVNVFAIDYRGFGLSDASQHPTEASMAQDTAAAFEYLSAFRIGNHEVSAVPKDPAIAGPDNLPGIPAGQFPDPRVLQSRIIPYGVGLGASLAAKLAEHYKFPAVILDNPDPDPTATAVAAHPSRLIPVGLLFRERFDTAAPLATLTTPKLLIAGGPNSTNTARGISALQLLFRRAASPSLTVTLPPANYETNYQTTLTRFLDEYLPANSRP